MKEIIEMLEKRREEAAARQRTCEGLIVTLESELTQVKRNLSEALDTQSQCERAIRILGKSGTWD